MTTDQLRTVILEAVDCLRQRKCRPDRESIAVYVMRKLGSSMTEIFSEIENIVDQGSLLKVEYKGLTSYRSPKSFDEKNSPLLTKHSKILNSSKTTRYIMSAMNELLTNPEFAHDGIPFEELKKKLLQLDKDRFAHEKVGVIFEREESAGNIQAAECSDPILENPLRIFPKDIQVPAYMKLITFVEDAQPSTEKGKKRKKIKKEDASEETEEAAVPQAKGKGGGRKSQSKDEGEEQLVYAVKSDPHKIADLDESMKSKAQLLSSIGMKVVTGKANAVKKADKAKGKNVKAKATAKPKVNESEGKDAKTVVNKTPSLALVKHETIEEDSKADESVRLNGQRLKQARVGKRKSDSAAAGKSVQSPVAKKKKLGSTSDAEEPEEILTITKTAPPRYTYSSKKRCRDDFDSVEYDDKKLACTPASNGLSSQCTYCKKEESPGNQDNFLVCGTCSAKFHPACIDYSEEQANRLKSNGNSKEPHLQWQCFSCKRCGVCKKALMSTNTNTEASETKSETKFTIPKKAEQRYILCDQCDRGYHVKCISINGPPSLNDSSWFCGECKTTALKNGPSSTVKKKLPIKKQVKKVVKKESSKEATSTTESKPANNGSHSSSIADLADQDIDNSENSDVPDISSWTPSQVQKFFTEKGLPDEAATLREQEIDGMSLLLLRRADVIFGLNLRLGPALKIYRLVCQLQQHATALKKKGENKTPVTTTGERNATN